MNTEEKKPSRYLRTDESIKNAIIESVIDATAKDALKDGKLFDELQKKTTIELLERYNAPDKNILAKTKDHAFRKDVYLLGCDDQGVFYWLEAPSWDCGWYWGFGYVETYKRNCRPSIASDIDSHTHIDGFTGQQYEWEYIEEIKKHIEKKSDYVHNLFDSKRLKYTTFDEAEGWKLSELFHSFYTLRDAAAMFRHGGAHITTNPVEKAIKDDALAKRINEIMIPAVTGEIIRILSPKV